MVVSFTAHNSSPKVRFPLYLLLTMGMKLYSRKWSVSLSPPQANALWVQGSEVMGPRRCQPHYPLVHQPNPEGFLSIYVPPDLPLLGNVPLFLVQAVPHSPVYPLFPGASGFKFTLSAAQTCWGYPVPSLSENTVWTSLSYVYIVCCPILHFGGNSNNVYVLYNFL